MSNERIAFIDFEASGLGPKGFPIEVGWGFPDTDEVESHLMKPARAWDTGYGWDPDAQAVHGISHHELMMTGEPYGQVARRLLKALKGCRIFSDAPLFDGNWLAMLVFAIGLDHVPQLEHFEGLLLETVEENCDFSESSAEDLARRFAAAYAHADKVAPHLHRAAADVRHLMAVYNAIVSSDAR